SPPPEVVTQGRRCPGGRRRSTAGNARGRGGAKNAGARPGRSYRGRRGGGGGGRGGGGGGGGGGGPAGGARPPAGVAPGRRGRAVQVTGRGLVGGPGGGRVPGPASRRTPPGPPADRAARPRPARRAGPQVGTGIGGAPRMPWYGYYIPSPSPDVNPAVRTVI